MLAYICSFGRQKALVINNLSRYSQYVELDLKELEGYIPEDLFGQNQFPQITKNPYLIMAGPYGYYWFGLNSDSTAF